MDTARQLIDDLQNETREESVSPQRLAGIYDAILQKQETDRRDLEQKINETGSGNAEIPADLKDRLDALGTTSANALEYASMALGASSEAAEKAESAKTIAEQAIGDIESYRENTDSKLEVLNDFQERIGNFSFWKGTLQEYDAITVKDSETIYFITE